MRALTYQILQLAAAGIAAGGVSVEIPLDKVPAEIMSAARKAAPLAIFTQANTETETDGTIVYEIGGKESKFTFESLAGKPSEIDLSELDDSGFQLQTKQTTLTDIPIEVDVLADGEIEEIERVVPESLVPAMVMKRIQQQYQGFKPRRIEASYNDHGRIFRYEFEGTHHGKSLDLEVSADGSKIAESDT
ncbi:hypothetical protein ACFQY0_09890 [Haloferula chungangensis]|uniref:PepSY domain-containing protein n=1 Tax=Haloferula chungangensis TaxID=1048331 RepID=A0ABW2L572_9BACT